MQVGDSDVGQLPYRQRAFRQELHISCYAKFLDAFVDVFGPGNVLITFFDDLSTSPGKLVNEICAFADIDPGHYDDFVFRVENQTRMHRSTSLQKISGALNSQLEPLLNRFPVLRRSARNLYDRINVRPSLDIAMPEESKQQLDEFFAPWNEQLASWMAATYPEKRLPGWLKG
jgi:hypothetical protein